MGKSQQQVEIVVTVQHYNTRCVQSYRNTERNLTLTLTRFHQPREVIRQGVSHPPGRYEPGPQRPAALGFQTLAGQHQPLSPVRLNTIHKLFVYHSEQEMIR